MSEAILIPEAIHICAACDVELATGSLICETCRKELEEVLPRMQLLVRDMESTLAATAAPYVPAAPAVAPEPVLPTEAATAIAKWTPPEQQASGKAAPGIVVLIVGILLWAAIGATLYGGWEFWKWVRN